MPKFRYKAIDETGSMVEREVVYPSEEILLGELARSGLSLVRIERIDKEEKEKKSIEIKLPFGGGVSDRDISIFCRQLGTMISAGLSVVDALDIIAEQLPNKRLSEAAKDVSAKVREGMSISSAMQMHPRVFPEFVVNLVKVGEETGGLDAALIKAAEYYEKIAMIKSKIKSASFYPTFVVVVATAIISGILYFLVPTFAQIYEGLGGELPLPTQMLIAASNALRNSLPTIIASIVIFSLVFRYLYRNNYAFRKAMHKLSLRVPKMSDLVVKSTMAKFARTMASLFSSGVALERAFEIAGQTAGNIVIKEAVDQARKAVTEGEPMYKALDKTGLFPKIVIAMIRVGEDTGRLDDMLETIARFYEDEFDKTVEGLIKLIEPMLIVFIGGAVGTILIALYLPIFKMGELIKS
ncbi:MAG: type II secretion system F family protein [Thermocrinis sp.]|jgi:type IV pilus assembly protein PilC|nr:type II secretion system F family protein [Thermocrinis sp.]